MKTMTEFIMEQEAPQVVEESFNEADLVSQFMALQAASANMSCVLEFATIAEFCESNEINMPESLVQEGFMDFLDKVREGIANFFQKIADWFKGLIKGATATFSKAKIQEMIAKLNGVKDDDLSADAKEKVKYIYHGYQILIHTFVSFKDIYTSFADACDKNDTMADSYEQIITGLDNGIATTKALAKDKIFKGDGSLVEELAKIESDKYSASIKDPTKVSDLIAVLSEINKTNFAKTGQQLIKDIDAAEHTFEELKTTEQVAGGTKAKPTSTPTETKITSAQARAIKSKFQTMANNIASAYDKITKKFVNIADEATKGIEIGDKKTYAKDLEKAKKESGKDTSEDLKR